MASAEPKHTKHIGKTKTHPGWTFSIVPADAWTGQEIFHELLAVVGPTMAQILGSKGTSAKKIAGGDFGDVNLAEVGSILASSLAMLPPAKLRSITEKVLADCIVQTAERSSPVLDVYGQIFSGKTSYAFELLGWALQVNYADFFERAEPFIAKLRLGMAKVLAAAPTPKSEAPLS